jgi:hypothetical protein
MATISETFSTGLKTLSSTTADRVTLAGGLGYHKCLISNVSGTTALHVNIDASEAAVKAQGTLTLDTNPSDAIAAQGTLTIAEPVTDGDTFTIDGKVYTLESTLTDGDGHIFIGANEAATKVNIVAAINGAAGAGTLYSGQTKAHPTVSAAAFSSDDCVLTARTAGAAGNSITLAETFTHGSNVFDDTELGNTTAGKDADTMTIGTRTYTFVDELDPAETDQIHIGASAAATQAIVETIFDLSGTAGVDYSAQMEAHPDVTIGAFSSDDAIITAVEAGAAGNSIATTETFAAGTNIFDATSLGTTQSGADRYATTATAAAEHLVVPPANTLELLCSKYGYSIELSLVGNGNTYVVQLVK